MDHAWLQSLGAETGDSFIYSLPGSAARRTWTSGPAAHSLPEASTAIGASTASRHLPRSPPPSADLFLRAVEPLLHVLGEDAGLDVGHGCCGPQSWLSSRARSGPAAARRSPGRGGGAGGGAAEACGAEATGEGGARRPDRLKEREGAATRGDTTRSQVHLKRGKKLKCQASTVMEEEV